MSEWGAISSGIIRRFEKHTGDANFVSDIRRYEVSDLYRVFNNLEHPDFLLCPLNCLVPLIYYYHTGKSGERLSFFYHTSKTAYPEVLISATYAGVDVPVLFMNICHETFVAIDASRYSEPDMMLNDLSVFFETDYTSWLNLEMYQEIIPLDLKECLERIELATLC